MLHFYSMSYLEVLALPAMTFWMLHRNIDRISAEESIRDLDVSVHSHTGEAIKEKMADLVKQLGTVIEVEQRVIAAKFDRQGLRDIAAIGDLTTNAYPR